MYISFSPQTCSKTHFSPWVCHFHICKVVNLEIQIFSTFMQVQDMKNKYIFFQEIVKRRGLEVHTIINSLDKKCNSSRKELKSNCADLQITSK